MKKSQRPVLLWLGGLVALILVLVTVGGVTRLTGSGLSITEWKPIMGAIPPLTQEAWEEAFRKYQQIPQFKIINSGMDLAGFKAIFFWEWFHRLLGRMVGVCFFLPWLYFVLRGHLSGRLGKRLLVGFFLGGAQGFLGWFMVQSGLAERTSVSHYRLAAHLSLALLILVYLFWVRLDLLRNPESTTQDSPRVAASAPVVQTPENALPPFVLGGTVALLCLQIIYGAFTAGLKAGFGYNTFPKMMGYWAHPDVSRLEPFWTNFLDNPAMVQLVHRGLGTLLLLASIGLLLLALKRVRVAEARGAIVLFAAMIWGQFLLGVMTLLLAVPVALGALHQLFACLVLLSGVNALHRTWRGSQRVEARARTLTTAMGTSVSEA